MKLLSLEPESRAVCDRKAMPCLPRCFAPSQFRHIRNMIAVIFTRDSSRGGTYFSDKSYFSVFSATISIIHYFSGFVKTIFEKGLIILKRDQLGIWCKHSSRSKSLSVFRGARTVECFKCFAEEMRIVIAAHNTYLLYGEVGRDEKLLCGRHS